MPRSSNNAVFPGEAGMLPLPALLSQAFVAFTIEFDNEFEHRVPHRTTEHGHTPGFPHPPWLVSLAMWNNYLQYVPEEGIAAGEYQRLLGMSSKGLHVWLTRLSRWWGYLRLDPPSTKDSRRIAPETRITATAGGWMAMQAWRPLTEQIEARWSERFGSDTFSELRNALRAVVSRLDPAIPDFFAVLEYDPPRRQRVAPPLPPEQTPIPRLLAKLLNAFFAEFEKRTGLPLAVCANLLRVAGDNGVRLRDLPGLAHLSGEGVASAIRIAEWGRFGLLHTQSAPGRGKTISLTPAGTRARNEYPAVAMEVEHSWQERFGEDNLRLLRTTLDKMAAPDAGGRIPLLDGLVSHPDCWRASLPPLTGLPHFPMVSHRGGFPDGS